MNKKYEISLSYIHLGLYKSGPRWIDETIESVNVLFDIKPPFRKRLLNETKGEFAQLFIKHLTSCIENQDKKDFSVAIQYLEKSLFN